MAISKKNKNSGSYGTVIGLLLIIGLLIALKKIIGILMVLGAIGAGIYGILKRDRFKHLQKGQQIGAIALILFCLVFGIFLAGSNGTSDVVTPSTETQQKIKQGSQQDEADQSSLYEAEKPKETKAIPATSPTEGSAKKLVNEEKSAIKLIKATVTRVVDGDTIYVKLEDGTEEKVRMIGVDTPESAIQHEPYGEEASNFTKKQLDGKEVYLEKDVSETDKYGRLLRYVWLEPPEKISEDKIRTKMFNAILLLEGYAQVATYPPDVKYVDYFTGFQKEAREANIGLWALESSTTEESTDTVQKDKIVYWTPGGKSYHFTKNCPTLSRSKTILEGSLSECPKSDPCDVCTK